MINKAYIRGRLSRSQLWGQLAEEAAELAQMALKMQRLEQGINTPRMSRASCVAGLNEELADVELCLEILQAGDRVKIDETKQYKTKRWADHLRQEESNND